MPHHSRRPARPRQAAGVTGADLAALEAERKEMGRDLRQRRNAARLTQAEFGTKAGAGRSTISNAENGSRDLGRHFWAACDRALGLGAHFSDWHRRACAGLAAPVPARPGPPTELPVTAALTQPASPADALAEYQRLGWPVTRWPAGPALVTGATVDALEVRRAAGVLAAHSWLESGGREDAVLGLPALPSPAECLAAIDAGDRWYILARSGASPWPASAPGHDDHAAARPRRGPDGVRWHADGSIPLPPSPAPGAGPVTWAFLPRPTLRLAPPVTVLHLLGRAAAMTRAPGALALPEGTLVTPAAGAGDNDETVHRHETPGNDDSYA